ncbi:MAG: hypothetical protein EB127_01520 [Alphaproteobacteria bacterium]|nr:hypothetical protein [Alphaproteobacteria bacterium]
MISEKIIYNLYLKTSRSSSGLPYRLRKQWHGFEDTIYYPKLLKLKNFFSRNKGVDIIDFFEAPYTIYAGESGFDLDFYSSQKAISIYTMAVKKKMSLDPDDKYHLDKISKGLKFIQKYCNFKQIKLTEYLKHKEGVQSAFVVHLKERRISIYNLLSFSDFDTYLKQNDPDLLRFTLGDIYDQIPVYRTKFLNSNVAKKFAVKGLEKIKQNLENC